MGKRIGVAAIVCCMMVACLALFACAPQVDKGNYTGEWELVSGSTENLDADSIALAQSMGATAVLNLNEDGTGSLNLYGDVSEVTWTASSNTEGSIKVGDSSDAKMKIEDSNLSIYDSAEESMTFARKS